MQTNEYLNTSLGALIKKIQDEGVEKGHAEAQNIIAAARQQSAAIIEQARQEAEKLKARVLNEMNRLRENVHSELGAAAQQTLSSIRNELDAIIMRKASLPEIKPALRDKDLLQQLIGTVLEKWGPGNTNMQFDLLLSPDDEAQLQAFFEQRIKKELALDVEVTIDGRISSGFIIGVRNENYSVRFTGEDFENFFKGFLHKKTLEWLYGPKKL